MDFLVTIAALSTLYPTVLGIIIQSLKSIGQFRHNELINQKSQLVMLKMTFRL